MKLCLCITSIFGETIESGCFVLITLNAPSFLAHAPKSTLRLCVSSLRGETIEPGCFAIIVLNAPSFFTIRALPTP